MTNGQLCDSSDNSTPGSSSSIGSSFFANRARVTNSPSLMPARAAGEPGTTFAISEPILKAIPRLETATGLWGHRACSIHVTSRGVTSIVSVTSSPEAL